MNKNLITVVDYSSPAGKKYLQKLLALRRQRDDSIGERVARVVDDIRKEGDKALFSYAKKFDGMTVNAKNVRIGQAEIDRQAKKVPAKLKKAMAEAAIRIKAYHRKQVNTGFSMKTGEGTLRQLIRPLTRVALYVPGGHTVYPSSVLMNAIPAKIAGVREIVAVTPPRKTLDPAIAFALKLSGITEVYRIGGAQAVAALAYGTKSIRPVDKIVGPGNAYVQAAKRLVFGTVDIDSVAGPSEVVILADGSADPSHVALDLLSQAEHGSGDELAVCVTESWPLAIEAAAHTIVEIENSPVRETLEKLPSTALTIFQTSSRREGIGIVNEIAPEHLQIMTRTAERDLSKIRNASAVFLGPHTPVALGDYFVGTNHVLPTGGGARFASPLGVDSFIKRISVAEISSSGLEKSASYVSTFARAEGFVHHALSVERRVEPGRGTAAEGGAPKD